MDRRDVQFYFVREAIFQQETVDCCDVVVVLMLGRFHRFRLDQNGSCEANPVLMFDRQR